VLFDDFSQLMLKAVASHHPTVIDEFMLNLMVLPVLLICNGEKIMQKTLLFPVFGVNYSHLS